MRLAMASMATSAAEFFLLIAISLAALTPHFAYAFDPVAAIDAEGLPRKLAPTRTALASLAAPSL